MKQRRTTKKALQPSAPKVLSSGDARTTAVTPDDVEETMLAVLDEVQALVCLAHGHEVEIIRNKAGSALVDILQRCFLNDWQDKSANAHVNVNLLLLKERNKGFQKRHSELYGRGGKNDELGAAVRSFTSELWIEQMMQESMSASAAILGRAHSPEVNGRTIPPRAMPLFDKWAASVNAFAGLPENPTTLDIDGAIHFARLEHFTSYWRDVFSKLAKDLHERWWALNKKEPSKEDAAILKNPLCNSTRFKELQAARENPPKWIEIVNHPWRNKIEDRVKKALFDWVASHGAARQVLTISTRRKLTSAVSGAGG